MKKIQNKIITGTIILYCILFTTMSYAWDANVAPSPSKYYSNMIIFGDSQSDIGNVPESGTLDTSVHHIPNDSGVIPNQALKILTDASWTPDSSPVEYSKLLYGMPYTVPGTKKVFTYPTLVKLKSYLGYQWSPLNGLHRNTRSVGWSEYYMNMMKNNFGSSILKPWVDIYPATPKYDPNVSVDYAFIGAQSWTDIRHVTFYRPQYGDIPYNTPTDPQNIYTLRQNYYNNNTDESQLEKMGDPGLGVQIKYFQKDHNDKKTYVDNNTQYIVWSGANDIAEALVVYTKNHNPLEFLKKIEKTIPDRVSARVKQLLDSGVQPKHIVVISQYNLGLLPVAPKAIPDWFVNYLVYIYNSRLKNDIKSVAFQYNIHHMRSKVDIQFLNLQHTMNVLSKKEPFADHNNQSYIATCNLLQRHNLEQAKGVDTTGYMFWNDEHLTTQGQQVVAYELYKLVNSDEFTNFNEPKPTKVVTANDVVQYL
ncbi:MAG TPA: SGNH/GDSL hydrolase family protein [Victivallales bacterium]|nr:SGNH/GDSL hydrolase family protein [Victivallales bacterium]